MEERFSIGKVAQLLDVPAATIRFWEERGLFSIKKAANHYRSYESRDLADIADIMFLRNCGVPVKKILHMRRNNLTQYQESLCQMEHHMKEQLRCCQQVCEQITKQQACANEILRLQQTAFQPEEVPFERIAYFDYHEKEKLLRYSQDPSLYVRYFDTRDMSTEARCIAMQPSDDDTDLCWKKSGDSRFLTFLIRERVEKNYESDVWASLTAVQKQYRTGTLLAQFLLTAVEDGEPTDFLKGYVEVF